MGVVASTAQLGEEEESQRPMYGPWIVVHKTNKKKGKKAGQGGKGSREVPPKNKALSRHMISESRFSSLNHMEDLMGEKVLETTEEGPPHSEGIILDQPMEQVGDSGPNPPRARSTSGGRNPQLGPRIRDAKKLARGNGLAKCGPSGVNGPKAILLKENISPANVVNTYNKGEGPGAMGLPVKDRILLLGSSSKILKEKIVLSVTTPTGQNESANPASGFVAKYVGVVGVPTLESSPSAKDAVEVQPCSKLSEQKTTPLSE